VRLALADIGAMLVAAWGTLLVHSGRPMHWADLASGAGRTVVVSLCMVVAFYYSGLYDYQLVPSFARFMPRLPRSAGLALLLLAGFRLLMPSSRLAEGLFISSLLGLGLVVALRAAAYGVIRNRSVHQRLLLVGSGSLARQLVAEIAARPHLRYEVVGAVDDECGAPPECPCFGRLEDLRRIVDEVRPDRIIVALASRRGRMPVQQLLDFRMRGMVLEDGAETYERITGKIAIESLTPTGLIFSHDFRCTHVHPVVGRALGLVLAAVGLLALAPLLGLIALAIVLDSRGPVLFVQDRVGLGGRRFRLLKFRTMHPAGAHPSEWVRDNGHRITRVGRWLRRFRLDELPQLVNILRGDMNLVGPRPHPVSNLALFVVMLRNAPECGERIPYYSLRSTVRPGLTGWAQVRYRYANDLEEEIEKMRYDLFYLKHRSLWLDLRIVLDTFKIVILGREQASSPADGPATASARTSSPPERAAWEPDRLRAGTAGAVCRLEEDACAAGLEGGAS